MPKVGFLRRPAFVLPILYVGVTAAAEFVSLGLIGNFLIPFFFIGPFTIPGFAIASVVAPTYPASIFASVFGNAAVLALCGWSSAGTPPIRRYAWAITRFVLVSFVGWLWLGYAQPMFDVPLLLTVPLPAIHEKVAAVRAHGDDGPIVHSTQAPTFEFGPRMSWMKDDGTIGGEDSVEHRAAEDQFLTRLTPSFVIYQDVMIKTPGAFKITFGLERLLPESAIQIYRREGKNWTTDGIINQKITVSTSGVVEAQAEYTKPGRFAVFKKPQSVVKTWTRLLTTPPSSPEIDKFYKPSEIRPISPALQKQLKAFLRTTPYSPEAHAQATKLAERFDEVLPHLLIVSFGRLPLPFEVRWANQKPTFGKYEAHLTTLLMEVRDPRFAPDLKRLDAVSPGHIEINKALARVGAPINPDQYWGGLRWSIGHWSDPIWDRVQQLSVDTRSTVLLHYFDGVTIEVPGGSSAIAEMFNCKPDFRPVVREQTWPNGVCSVAENNPAIMERMAKMLAETGTPEAKACLAKVYERLVVIQPFAGRPWTPGNQCYKTPLPGDQIKQLLGALEPLVEPKEAERARAEIEAALEKQAESDKAAADYQAKLNKINDLNSDLSELKKALVSQDWTVRSTALHALVKLGDKNPEETRGIFDGLRLDSKQNFVTFCFLECPHPEFTIDYAQRVLASPDSNARLGIYGTIGNLPLRPFTLAFLEKGLKDPEPTVRGWVACRLWPLTGKHYGYENTPAAKKVENECLSIQPKPHNVR